MFHKLVVCLLAAVLLCASLGVPLKATAADAGAPFATALTGADQDAPCEPRCDQDDLSDDLATQPHADPLQDSATLLDTPRLSHLVAMGDAGPARWRSAMHLSPCLAGPQRPPCSA